MGWSIILVTSPKSLPVDRKMAMFISLGAKVKNN